MLSKSLRFLLLLSVLVYLAIPAIDFIFIPHHGPTTQGSYTVYEKPSLSIKNWFSGDFQSQFDRYFNQQFQYRTFFIELNNQFYLSCFKEARANGTVIGENNYMYESKYISSYLGKDFLGKEKLNEKINKLIRIQNYLKEQHTDMILILAPNKARFYPEYFPSSYRSDTKRQSNFDYMRSQLKKTHLNYIDFDSWLIALKGDTSMQPHEKLFTKYGTHWSEYSGLMAADSLLRYITSLKKIPRFSIIIDSVQHTHEARGTDHDIGDGLNLLFHLPKENYWYPNYHVNVNSSLQQLSILAIGDSFYWNSFYFLEKEALVKKNTFWYFNKQVYPESFTKQALVDQTMISTHIKSYDVVIFMISEPELYKIPFEIDEYIPLP